MRLTMTITTLAFLAGCMSDAPVETPDRAIRSFNGSSVVVQAKGTAPTDADTALARTACPGATYQTTISTIPSSLIGVTVSDYLFVCK
jgi:hypothetical protein